MSLVVVTQLPSEGQALVHKHIMGSGAAPAFPGARLAQAAPSSPVRRPQGQLHWKLFRALRPVMTPGPASGLKCFFAHLWCFSGPEPATHPSRLDLWPGKERAGSTAFPVEGPVVGLSGFAAQVVRVGYPVCM